MGVEIPEEYRDLLERVVVGDVDADEPRAREMLEKCAPCREQLEKLRRLQSTLDGLGAEEQDVVQDVGRSRAADPRVDAVLRAQIGGRPREKSRAALFALLAVAAAVLLLVVFHRPSEPRRPGPSGSTLGSGVVELLEPAESARDFETFRWRYELPDGYWFELEILDSSGQRLIPTKKLTETKWTPTREERDRFTPEIHWRVVVTRDLADPIARAERVSRIAR